MMAEISTAKYSELAAILSIQKLCYQENGARYNNYNIAPLLESLAGIEADFRSKTILKAIVDGKIVGSVRAHKNETTCFIGRLVVLPEYQNCGIGSRLLSEVELCFANVNRYELFTGHQDEKNLHLYQRCGYRKFRTEEVEPGIQFIFLEKQVTGGANE